MTTRISRLTTVCTLCFVTLIYTRCGAEHIYDVEIYDGFDTQWSMDGGTITTNGFVVALDNSNIGTVFTDWSVSFTSPNNSYTLTPVNSAFSFEFDSIGNGGTVNSESIFIGLGASAGDLTLLSGSGQSLSWHRRSTPVGGGGEILGGGVTLEDGALSSRFTFPFCDDIDDPGCVLNVLVAAVPEPSALMYLTLGMITLIRMRR